MVPWDGNYSWRDSVKIVEVAAADSEHHRNVADKAVVTELGSIRSRFERSSVGEMLSDSITC